MECKLNNRDLLIEDAMQLLDFDNSEIDVWLTKEQYIQVFSNKSNLYGWFFDENMGVAIQFFVDPAQCEKTGAKGANGEIGVKLFIYRNKCLIEAKKRTKGTFTLEHTMFWVQENSLVEIVNNEACRFYKDNINMERVTAWENQPLSEKSYIIEGIGIGGYNSVS